MTKSIVPLKENVCMSINEDCSVYAIGSTKHVQLIDCKSLDLIQNQLISNKDIAVRSLCFKNNILSIGTGIGTILFYDLRMRSFVNGVSPETERTNFKLQASGGWIVSDLYFF
jgi:DDB1- and CUL4-associated factor 12